MAVGVGGDVLPPFGEREFEGAPQMSAAGVVVGEHRGASKRADGRSQDLVMTELLRERDRLAAPPDRALAIVFEHAQLRFDLVGAGELHARRQ